LYSYLLSKTETVKKYTTVILMLFCVGVKLGLSY